jgi:hypothetical protein
MAILLIYLPRGATGFGFFTSVGEVSTGPGRGCFFAMWVEREYIGTCSPQNRQRAFPGET